MGMDCKRLYKKSSQVTQILDTWDSDMLNPLAESLSSKHNLNLTRHKNNSSSGDNVLLGPHFSQFSVGFVVFQDPIYCNLSHAGQR